MLNAEERVANQMDKGEKSFVVTQKVGKSKGERGRLLNQVEENTVDGCNN